MWNEMCESAKNNLMSLRKNISKALFIFVDDNRMGKTIHGWIREKARR